jgi:glycerol transport system ATP-binding protein
MAEITLKGLAHSYKAHPTTPDDYALKRIDHVWRQGGAYALLGPSGCGKTTLLNIISGLVVPSEGAVLFDGKDVTRLPTERRNIAQVFQFPVIYDTMTVAENLAFPLKNRGMARPAIDKRVAEIAALLDLDRYLGRRARGLTADAKQKISLGRGLVRPDVAAVLFDEPLTVIDPVLKWELRSKLKALHRQLDITMIYVTHDQTEALTFADTVVVMHDGAVVQMGTPAELFDKPAHTFVGYFIGSPGMNLIKAEVEGTRAKVGSQTIELAKAYRGLPKSGIEIGIRPEFARLAKAGAGYPVSIRRIDDLGARRIARLDFAGTPVAALAPEAVDINGSEASVLFDPAHIHVYANGALVEGEAVSGTAPTGRGDAR